MNVTILGASLPAIVEAVRQVAAERPDYINNPNGEGSCVYWRDVDGKRVPSCIVGHGLARVDVLDSLSDGYKASTVGTLTDGLIRTNRIYWDDADRAAAFWLSAAQRRQDNGDTWAEAVRIADDEARLS